MSTHTPTATPPERMARVTSAEPHPHARRQRRLLKRLLLGRALPTSSLRDERLGKPTALAVFASDNLSSSAYATEEILKVAVPAVGGAAFSLVMPITLAMLGVLAILLVSYRQTIKAYPSAGGAYVVTKDNFGILPAQLAGAALLTDYVLTVAVSIAAGVAAITSAVPATYPYRVELAVAFIWIVAWGNLRGVRESGRIFMLPTYFFILMMLVLLGVGIARVLSGDLQPLPIPDRVASTTGMVGWFLVLHAFASGGAAVTGVEAVSNGVPAFRPPEWRNARTTLMWMGGLLGAMFLGLSFLAVRLHALPTETTTLNSQIARAVFGAGELGHALFLMVQVATMAILILAANTSFADFPRLANFQATDSFLPRQLRKRGHRLVFSNGIAMLAATATGLVIAFDADVHRLIPLYAVGVFTSFTLSQAGMARRHVRRRERGWRRGTAINGLGATVTAVVTVVIATTKFVDGAWAILVLVPLMVVGLIRTNRHYRRGDESLALATLARAPDGPLRLHAVIPIDRLDPATVHTLQYAHTIRPEGISVVHVERDPDVTAELIAAWDRAKLSVPLRILRGGGDGAGLLAGFVGGLPDDRPVAVLIPVTHDPGRWERLSDARAGARIAHAMSHYEHVSVTLVRDHPEGTHPLGVDEAGRPVVRLAPRSDHRVVVPIDDLDAAGARAISHARSLGAISVRAVHAGLDPDEAEVLMRRWLELEAPIPLDVIECWDRDVPRSLERYVLELARGDREITVVMPRRDFPTLRERLLHDRTSRSIVRRLTRYPHIDVSVVPYAVRRRTNPKPQASASPIQR